VGKDDDSSKTEVDKRFDNIQAYINELDVQIQQVAKHASNLVKKQEALGSTMYDFGFAFTQLAGAEKDTVPLGQALQHMGEKADSVSVAYKAQALKEGESFEGPINEYVKIIGALKQAMSKRQDKKITYMTAAHEVEQRNLAHQKLQGVTGKEDKLRQAEEQLHNAKATLDAAKADFEKVTRRVLKEFERFRQEKARDLKQIMLDYVNIQVEYTRKQEASWTELIPQLEAMEVEGSGNMYTSKTGGAQSRASDQMVGV
jgi:sorting nexin-1/2